jgi:viologen exporter family transport system permease protein
MRYIRLLWAFFRVSSMREIQYRTSFVIQAFQSLIGLGTGLAGLGVVFSHTSNLGGWKPSQLLAVLGVYFLVGGVINLVIRPSMQRFMEDVRLGTLDYVLTKPRDSQFLVSVREVQIWKVIDVLMGVVVLVIAIAGLAHAVGIWQALGFGAALIAGSVIVYSFFMVLATLCFWVVRADNILVIFLSVYDAGRWPVTIYPGALRWTLTFLVPVAFAVTVPAEALTGRLTATTLIEAGGLAVVLLLGSRWFWNFGLIRYTGASA